MNLKPLGDRVIIKQDPAEETTASGLILSAKSQEKPQRGTVIAVGEGKPDNNGNIIKPAVKAGDKVIYGKYGGTTIKEGDEEYMILRSDDIYAIVED